jgi:hypothetical protein
MRNLRSYITWRANDIDIVLDKAHVDDPIVTALITTPAGKIEAMASVYSANGILTLSGLHIQTPDAGAGSFGAVNLRRLADALMEELDCEGIRIEGAARTTGSGPGRRQILRFRRRVLPEGRS